MLRILTTLSIIAFGICGQAAEPVRVGVFDVDASPPVGSPLAYDSTAEILNPLSCRGVVLLGAEAPIVLCGVDWIGIGNDGHRIFREKLAAAVGTSPDRVAVHALHQHDAPWCDFTIDELVATAGVSHRPFDSRFARSVMERAAEAAGKAARQSQSVTHLGLSSAKVEKVASNRRILGPNGKVMHVRWSATGDPIVRDFPEGVIDAALRMISFWNEEKPLAVLTYYATHPQSYYRTGKANPDFPGIARNLRQVATEVPHIHFNGAGGNVTAGKYNDGAHENRQVLANRLADAMGRAWQDVRKQPLTADQIRWKSIALQLPTSPHLDEQSLANVLKDANQPAMKRFVAASQLAWLKRTLRNEPIDVSCLTLADARVLHMPGELFVEYQLEAQRLRQDLFVAMAAYGDYAPMYIGTAASYAQGGYEVGPESSLVAPEVEEVLMRAIAELLEVNAASLRPLVSK